MSDKPAEGFSIDLTPDVRDMQKWVHEFAKDVIRPAAAEWDEREETPWPIIEEAAKIGLYSLDFFAEQWMEPSGLGTVVAFEELFWGDAGIGLSLVGSGLAAIAVASNGTPEQIGEWLPQMFGGPGDVKLAAFCSSEPDAGSDPAAMRTHARREGGDWVLSGTKMWITNGSLADIAVVWAQTDDGIRGFLVERGTPGFSARDIEGKLSLRASVTSELILDEVRVPEASMLPEARGLSGALACLDEARFGIAWGVLGAARACFTAAVEYARSREAFGHPIAHFQLTQAKLAEMATRLVQGRLVAHRLGTLKDAGRVHTVQVSLAKRANTRTAIEIARAARTILGANGLTLDYPVARHMANLEAVLTYEGTEEVHTLILGKAITGEDAFG